MRLADMTNTDGSGTAPSTTPAKAKVKLKEVVKARRKMVNKTPGSPPETPWSTGT